MLRFGSGTRLVLDAMAAVSSSGWSNPTLVKRAAALREKCSVCYVAGSPHRRLTLDAVAPHQLNRNGVRLNGQRCEELFMQVCRNFDFSEASHGAVCVEFDVPPDSFREYHLWATGDERIAILLAASLRYASLGSSHINQVRTWQCRRERVPGCGRGGQ